MVRGERVVRDVEPHDPLPTKWLAHPHSIHARFYDWRLAVSMGRDFRQTRADCEHHVAGAADEEGMPRRSPGLLLVHIVWATLGRRRTLPTTFDDVLAAILGGKARDASCALVAVGCASDHVHVLLPLSPSVTLADVVQRLEGASAYDINQHCLLPDRLACQAGYRAESYGPADTQPLVQYLRAQRLHHDDSHPAEQWQFAERESAEGGL